MTVLVSSISANELTDRSINARWISINLENGKHTIFSDLKIIQTHFSYCFPRKYNIVMRFFEMYHTAISKNLKELVDSVLNTREEIFEILAWTREYHSENLLRNLHIVQDIKNLPSVLDLSVKKELYDKYLNFTKEELANYMNNTLRSEKQLWNDPSYSPHHDGEGKLKSEVVYLISSYFERTLMEAKSLSDDLCDRVFRHWIDELEHFLRSFIIEMDVYRDNHRKNRGVENDYVNQIIANSNSFHSLIKSITLLCQKFTPKMEYDYKFTQVIDNFKNVSAKLCNFLLEELIHDTKPSVTDLFTPKWIMNRNIMATINVTIEDYNEDFKNLFDDLYISLFSEIKNYFEISYYQAMFSSKITFKNKTQRQETCEQIRLEISTIHILFKKICPSLQATGTDPFSSSLVKFILDPLESADTELLSFELEAMKIALPGLKRDKIVNFLSMREDLSKNEAELKIKDVWTEETSLEVETFFSRLFIPDRK